MGDRRTIEDVLPRSWTVRGVTVRYPSPEERVKQLHAATADGPVPSADGSIAVIRTDPELANRLRAWADDRDEMIGTDERVESRTGSEYLRRAAALLAAPAPADPEGDDE